MKVTARLAHESLRFDQAAATHLVLTLTAPPIAAGAPRPPVCVIPVIDVSGSMDGAKLDMAKQSLLKLVDNLAPGDLCGVVAFSSWPAVVAPVAAMSPEAKAALKLRIGALRPLANTNLSGGLLEGLGLANAGTLPSGTLVRVILFTDGHANAGIATTSAQLLPLLDAHRGRATVSAFGYGLDADQELLADLARRGAGNYAFITGPDAAMTAFARELGGLLSTFATDLAVRVTPAPGARVTAVLADVDSSQEGGTLVLRADDILAEEERHLVLAVELAPLAAPETRPAFQVEVSWLERRSDGLTRAGTAAAVSVDRVEPALARPAPDPALDVLVTQARLLAVQLQAEALAREGRYGQASSALHGLAREAMERGHGAVAQAAQALADKMRDAAAYAASAHMRKSMHSAMRRGASSGEEAESFQLLSRMERSVYTSSQDLMAEAFRSGAPGGTEPAPVSRSGPPDPTGGAARRRGGAGDAGAPDDPSTTPQPPSTGGG